MEFIEPVAEEPEKKPENSTDETVQLLESEIDKAYSAVETRFQDLWKNASKNASGLQEKYKLEEHKSQLLDQLNQARSNIQTGVPIDLDLDKIKHSATNALDSLDSTLEQVEKQAGQYVNQFTSFFSNIVSIVPKEEEETKDEVLFSLNDNYGTSRYDTDLFKLHTTPGFYTDETSDEAKAFDADSEGRTEQIAALLDKYQNTLTKLMNDLVPVKLPYNQFWYWYFYHENKLRESENKRKELINKKSGSDHAADDEEFTWDDDDDEEPVDVAKEVKPPADAGTENEDDDWE